MILLTRLPRNGDPPVVIALFGAGLLGGSIVNAITGSSRFRAEQLDLVWNDPSMQARQLETLEAKILAAVEPPAGGAKRASLKFHWSAGRAGFASTDAETANELDSFRAVLGMAERVARRLPSTRTAFYLLSSAGGLFQGQRYVDASSKPSPRIPYGLLKLRQEQLLGASDAGIAKRIYRLTSVYGHVHPHQRLGLISTLICHGVRRGVAPITGWMSTLRDFIFVEDVARFIAPRLMDEGEDAHDSTAVLAHGKPCSLLEIQRIVERALGHKIYVRYSLDPSNREDITFSHSVLPPGWQASDVRSNISHIYLEAVASGAVFGRLPGLVGTT